MRLFSFNSPSLHAIRRKHLENTLAQQTETMTALRAMIDDAKEVLELQKAVNANDKEMKDLLAEAAGLKI